MYAPARIWAIVGLLGLTIACGEDQKTSRIQDSGPLALPPGICGNGEIEDGETCDDGNLETEFCDYGLSSCTVCDAKCQSIEGETSFCGDGVLQEGQNEACDDGNMSNEDACTDGCRAAYCGDGFSYTGMEDCDDGNTDAFDACSPTCEPEVGHLLISEVYWH